MLGDVVGGQGHRDHSTLPAQGAECLGAQGHDAGTVGKGQGAGDAGGGDLALGVSDHGGGVDAVGLPDPGQGHHQRPQHGLKDLDPLKAGLLGGVAQDGE